MRCGSQRERHLPLLAMSNNLFDEYSNAVATGNSGYADYLGQIMRIGDQQYGTEFNTAVGGSKTTTAPATENQGLLYPYSGTGSNLTGAAGWLLGAIGTPLGTLFGGSTNPFQNAQSAAGAAQGIQKGTIAGLDFITDIPRVATTLIGGIMIAVGLIALTREPAIILENVNLGKP